MGRIVLSAPVNRSDEAESVIVEFRLYPTDELLAAAGRGDIPGFLLPGVNIGSPISTPLWTISPVTRLLRTPGPLEAFRLTAAQRREMEAWLDRVIPGWESETDSYGNSRVTIRDAALQDRVDEIDRQMARAWREGPGAEA